MLFKAFVILAGLSVLCRWALGKWPWEVVRFAPGRRRAVNSARALLGVAPAAGREDIIAAHRRLTAQVHPDRGGSTTAMQEANAARDLLLAELTGAQAGPGE
ncbi:molecular chaperone DnaJ [Porphyrobacter sp. TH134]|uniref:molecular chaperone DnaJ n=1 Tax=Porphyrobacter sp. TH134 TaxID=2067450 RepID=UPI001554FF6B|nr:molecular chaperone DnaJ [Porphyrobacter sp. TH134]